MPVRYRFPSLEDFLTASELTVDGTLDDGWGAQFAVKGRGSPGLPGPSFTAVLR